MNDDVFKGTLFGNLLENAVLNLTKRKHQLLIILVMIPQMKAKYGNVE